MTAPQNPCSQDIPRDEQGRFAPGSSGNPGGRPMALVEVRNLARTFTEVAIKTLAVVAVRGENEGARVAAANALLDRGWGKPGPAINVDMPPLLNADDAVTASSAVIAAVAGGSLGPADGTAFASLIGGFLKAVEIANFETRLAEIERRLSQN